MKKVQIIWLDSCGPDGWVNREDYEPMIGTVSSFGYVLKETGDYICICGHICDNNFLHSPIAVPKCSIIEINEI